MIEFKKDRPNIYGLMNGIGGGSDLMFAGHIDTVPVTGWKEHWQGTDREDPFSAVTFKDEIWGRGASDMKAGVVAPLFALKAIKDSKVVASRGSSTKRSDQHLELFYGDNIRDQLQEM